MSGIFVSLVLLLDGTIGVPKFIAGFDYSPKQVAFNYFLKSCIEELELEEFRDFFGYNEYGVKGLKNKNIRHSTINRIPKELRRYLIYSHQFARRDLKLVKNYDYEFLTDPV